MRTSFVCFVLFLNAAYAQLQSGTIVVFQLTPQKFVIAADSRAAFESKPPEDTHCKIGGFKSNKVVIGVTAAAAYPSAGRGDLLPSWSAISEVEKALSLVDPKTADDASQYVTDLARAWSANLVADWTQSYWVHPELVVRAAKANNGTLTNGILAAARRGRIAIAFRTIAYRDGKIQVEVPSPLPDCQVAPCASGETAVFDKYIHSRDDYVDAPQSVTGSFGYELLRAVRLVDLTIAYDKTGAVHGPIDALEMTTDGSITWKNRKQNCPESSD